MHLRHPIARPPHAAPGRRWLPVRVLVAAVLLSVGLAGCHATQRQYERRGIAGAILTLSGVATGLVGRSMVQNQEEPTAGIAVATIGATAQVVGIVLLVHALDGVIKPPPEYQPVHRWVSAEPFAAPRIELRGPVGPMGWPSLLREASEIRAAQP